KELKYPALQAIQVPNIQTFTLANGLKLCLLEDHELPLVDGMALVRAGKVFDPADKVGLSALTGVLMRSGGAGGRTAEQLDDQLDNIAAPLEVRVGDTQTSAVFSALKENADEVLGVFSLILTAPAFLQDKIEPVKNQLRNTVARRNEDSHT